ncbi:DUF5391 family protein [Shouchella hunanensis]|uniref:DUF5391 family protein n=1 Tax=Shouchella hunanensis TaxID=766894 RepID=UPI003D814DB0
MQLHFRKKIIIFTLLSFVVFSSLIMSLSLSEVLSLGGYYSFNDVGMWTTLFVIFLCYSPLILYIIGHEKVFYILSLFCIIGLILSILILLSTIAFSYFLTDFYSNFANISVIIGSIILIIINSIWCVIAFEKN